MDESDVEPISPSRMSGGRATNWLNTNGEKHDGLGRECK